MFYFSITFCRIVQVYRNITNPTQKTRQEHLSCDYWNFACYTNLCQYVTTTRLPSIFHRQIKSLHNTLEEHSRLTNVAERKTHPLLRSIAQAYQINNSTCREKFGRPGANFVGKDTRIQGKHTVYHKKHLKLEKSILQHISCLVPSPAISSLAMWTNSLPQGTVQIG